MGGIEAGPLSQWLVSGLSVPVICVDTRHMKALLQAQQVNKSDRNDARGIAQMMRVGMFRPVQVKTLAAQEQRTLLTSCRLIDIDIASDVDQRHRLPLGQRSRHCGRLTG
jgi:transposase